MQIMFALPTYTMKEEDEEEGNVRLFNKWGFG